MKSLLNKILANVIWQHSKGIMLVRIGIISKWKDDLMSKSNLSLLCSEFSAWAPLLTQEFFVFNSYSSKLKAVLQRVYRQCYEETFFFFASFTIIRS